MTISEQINHSVLGILLAGGDSSRFGKRNKLFIEIEGRSIIETAAQNLIDSGVESVKVVTGYQEDLVEKELSHLDIEFLYNGDWRVGQSTSVRRGLRAVSKEEAVLFALGDMPFVKSSSIDKLIFAQGDGEIGKVFVAGCGGKKGNPVLFRSSVLDALEEVLRGDEGGNSFIQNVGMSLVETGDKGVLCDIDTIEDLENGFLFEE